MCGRSLPGLALAACLLLYSDWSPAAGELTVPRRMAEPRGELAGEGSRWRRSVPPGDDGAASGDQLYLSLPALGTQLGLSLRRDLSFLSPAFSVEERAEGEPAGHPSTAQQHCFYSGHVLGHSRSFASLSTCSGLFGYIQIGDDLLSIEPVNKINSSFIGEVHQIYRHKRSPTSKKNRLFRDFCKVIKGRKRLKKADGWRPRRNAIRLTNEYTVETVVVADSDMVEYHGAEAAQRFILTVMNMVYNMFQHHSLGIKINIRVTKLVLLHSRPEQLLIGHHGERSLESFCHWQYKEFGAKYLGNNQVPGGKDDFPAVDTAVFVTRTDFCVHKDEPCDTVGIAYLGGACSAKRKCVLAEDNGLNLAFTIAHELGHKDPCLYVERSYCRQQSNWWQPQHQLEQQQLTFLSQDASLERNQTKIDTEPKKEISGWATNKEVERGGVLRSRKSHCRFGQIKIAPRTGAKLKMPPLSLSCECTLRHHSPRIVGIVRKLEMQ